MNKKYREWIFVAGLLVGLSTFGAEVADNQATEQIATTNMTGAAALWEGMLQIGMISDEQFRHVQETGYLPGGSTVTNSPISAESQTDWNLLAKQELITPDELAAMIFGGDIPGLTDAEERAFVELAPVYQPKRARRLTYKSRRKHARVELIRLGHRLRKEGEAFEERARLLGIPMTRGEGVLMSIDEEGRPFYSEPSGMANCDTISTDEVWGTNRVNAAGLTNTNFNLTGAGITLAMWETKGIYEEHQEFAGRVVDHAGTTWFHANTVGAIMVGAGVTNGSQGMAPAANLHVYRHVDRLAPELTEVADYGSISTSTSPPTTNLVRFSNHSYLTHSNLGYYNYIDSNGDDLVYKALWHLPVWAAGNDRGYNESTGEYRDYVTVNAGIAKNVLCVGACEEREDGYAGASNVVMTAKSGWGPTGDGRIKPDLVAGGFAGGDIPHFEGETNDYFYYGGYATSYAAPAVTGSLGLLQELHERLSGTNGIPLLASTYKGIIIHTADEAGNAPGPDYGFGWGVMNTLSAAELMAENSEWNSKPFIKELMLPDGEEVSFFMEADTNLPLRVTICWSDPPYEQTSGTTLVNDLDLRIIDPTGQTNFFPWVLDPTYGDYFDNRGNPASTGDNTVDNVEQVEVTNTVAGAYTVLINHKGTLVNDKGDADGQEVSIILSGLLPENIDTSTVFSFTTNGLPRFEITDALGSVYEISNRNDLIYSDWVAATNSPLNVLQPPTEWIDPDGSTYDLRFYKINQTR